MSRWWVAIIFFSMEFFQTTHAASPEDEVETLDMVEITGTAVPEKGRDILFPIPSLSSSATNPYHPDVPPANFWERPPITSQPRFLLDQTAHLRGFTTPVKPLKAEHPSYPRQAREHGWHGVVVVQVHINEQGLVESAEIKESSGHPLLDAQAYR